MAGVLSKDTELHYFKAGSPGAFARIDYLMEVPELGGDPEKVEVTTLQDGVKKYIPGVQDPGDLQFKFLYDNAGATSNFRVLKGLQDAGAVVQFKVVFPDETEWEFDAYVTVKIDSAAVNAALTFTATMTLQSEYTVTNPGA